MICVSAVALRRSMPGMALVFTLNTVASSYFCLSVKSACVPCCGMTLPLNNTIFLLLPLSDMHAMLWCASSKIVPSKRNIYQQALKGQTRVRQGLLWLILSQCRSRKPGLRRALMRGRCSWKPSSLPLRLASTSAAGPAMAFPILAVCRYLQHHI